MYICVCIWFLDSFYEITEYYYDDISYLKVVLFQKAQAKEYLNKPIILVQTLIYSYKQGAVEWSLWFGM